jgi:uncharacterized protein (DUF2225 family)
MVRCPYCGFQGDFKTIKTWSFLFYSVERLECPNCRGIFNHYHGTSPRGKAVEFTIKVKPRSPKTSGKRH